MGYKGVCAHGMLVGQCEQVVCVCVCVCVCRTIDESPRNVGVMQRGLSSSLGLYIFFFAIKRKHQTKGLKNSVFVCVPEDESCSRQKTSGTVLADEVETSSFLLYYL